MTGRVLFFVTLGILSCGCRPSPPLRCPDVTCRPSRPALATAARLAPGPPAVFGFKKPRHFGLPLERTRPRSVAIDRTGRLMAVGGRYGDLKLVRLEDGRVLRSLGHTEELVDGLLVRFSPSGRRLVSARHDLTRVRVWDVPGGRLIKQFRTRRHPIHDLAITANGRVLLATPQGVEVWHEAKGRLERTVKLRFDLPAYRVAASLRDVAAAGDRSGNLVVFAPSTGVRLGMANTPGSRLVALDISNCGSVMAAGFEKRIVHLYDTSPLNRRRAFRLYTDSRPVRVRLSRDCGRVVVAERAGRISVVDAHRGRKLASHKSRTGALRDFVVSPDELLLASVSRSGNVEIWQSERALHPLVLPEETSRQEPPPPRPSLKLVRPARVVLDTPELQIDSFAVGRRGRFLAVGGAPEQVGVYYVVLRPRRGKRPTARRLYRRMFKGRIPAGTAKRPVRVAITPNRSWLVAHGRGFYLKRWALVSGRPISSWIKRRYKLISLLPGANSQLLVTTTDSRQVVGWSLAGHRRFVFEGLRDAYWAGISPPGDRLVLVQGWDRVAVYDLPSGRLRWERPSGPLKRFSVLALQFSPDGRHLYSYHRSGFLRIVDLQTGALVRRVRIPLPDATRRCAIRPDVRILACAHPGGVELLELPSGARLGRLDLPGGSGRRVRELVYSLKGNALVAQTARRQLTLFHFDQPGAVSRYSKAELAVRIRLGLPLRPPRVQVSPGQIRTGRLLKDPSRVLRARPRPRIGPTRQPQPRLPPPRR